MNVNSDQSGGVSGTSYRWTRDLSRYHWFVLIICTLGWMFDTMDQHLFNLARVPAIRTLTAEATLAGHPPMASIGGISIDWGMLATSMLLLGWGAGGILFGMMGDRIGRAKTMIFTILAYSVFTGLSGMATSVYDFCFYRFLMGCGVGAQFAVGVSLVAETVPARARPHALGFLQACSALGNVAAALIGILFSQLIAFGYVAEATHWRYMFFIGVAPALLALIVMRYLKEPEAWLRARDARQQRVAETGVKEPGPLREIFSHPTWRRNAICGMILASSGILGLWSIGVFTPDLNRQVLRKVTVGRILADEPDVAQNNLRWLRTVSESPDARKMAAEQKIDARSLIAPDGINDTELDAAFRAAMETSEPVPAEANFTVWPSPEVGEWITSVEPLSTEEFSDLTEQIIAHRRLMDSDSAYYAAVTLLFFMGGAFFGIYGYTILTGYVGRRPAFFVALLAAAVTTALYFLYVDEPWMVYAFSPIVGFCQLAPFGGYAIYFPELFPTRVRSTGTSFCYNIARFVAALGPLALAWLKQDVFGQMAEPLRYGGAVMCVVFLIGIAALPFAPETKDRPLPE